MASVLILDDDESIRHALSRVVQRLGHHPETANDLRSTRASLSRSNWDAVFLDVRLPDGSGLDLLPELNRLPDPPETIILTGEGNPDGAELAMVHGAWDYIEKSASVSALSLTLSRALDYRNEKKKAATENQTPFDRGRILGTSPVIKERLRQIAQAAASDVSVLLSGETGTGKELFAEAIHANSARRHAPFVVVDCAAMPESLIESLLFGHKKGAFTGANQNETGLVRKAHGGTLFLDEIGELPLSLQKAFLRVLQERTVRPVGATCEEPVDFRLVAATHRDLDRLVENGAFRQDLLFRIRAFPLSLPPLTERMEDLAEIAAFHLKRIAKRNHTQPKTLTSGVLSALSVWDWPGNVRELVNTLEYAVVAAGGAHHLVARHLPTAIRVHAARLLVSTPTPASPGPLPLLSEFRDAAMKRAEKDYLEALMKDHPTLKDACRISGLSQSRLYALLKAHGLPSNFSRTRGNPIPVTQEIS